MQQKPRPGFSQKRKAAIFFKRIVHVRCYVQDAEHKKMNLNPADLQLAVFRLKLSYSEISGAS